jgi:4-amino-4-deoxy-L-arabinose transferase-like glycosyltransferase
VTDDGRTIRRPFPLKRILYPLLGIFYLGFLLGTLSSVPFHPDEATYIYMSRDLDRILAARPVSICWNPARPTDPLQVERERDAPLTRYTIGIARALAGITATTSNWNWTADWTQNLLQGAVPSNALLLAARLPQALLLFLTVLLMARLGWHLGGEAGAVSAAALLAFNSQILLHARRAMSEGALVFGMVLVMVVVLDMKGRRSPLVRGIIFPLLAGVALAIAASAKYSGLLVAPPALAGMFLGDRDAPLRKTVLRGMARSGVMALGFLLVFLAINPVYWCHPLAALSAAIAQRQSLLAAQVNALRTAAPGLVLDSFPLRLLAVPYQLFIAPLAFWDIPNYAQITAASEYSYLSNPINTITSGGILPPAWCVLSLAGLALVVARGVRRGSDGRLRVLGVWFLSVLAGILAGVPILWQRYYLPLIPVCAALSAVAVAGLTDIARRLLRPSTNSS